VSGVTSATCRLIEPTVLVSRTLADLLYCVGNVLFILIAHDTIVVLPFDHAPKYAYVFIIDGLLAIAKIEYIFAALHLSVLRFVAVFRPIYYRQVNDCGCMFYSGYAWSQKLNVHHATVASVVEWVVGVVATCVYLCIDKHARVCRLDSPARVCVHGPYILGPMYLSILLKVYAHTHTVKLDMT
jgi:hypothetical protein